MRDLLQKIVEMPVLTFSKEELAIFIDLVHQMKNKSGIDFLITLKVQNLPLYKIGLKSNNILLAMDYLNAWNDITNTLTTFYNRLAAAYLKITSHEPSADDLTEITIRMLPDDISLLNKAKPQIEFAELINAGSEIQYALTTLKFSLYVKAELLNPKSDISKLPPPNIDFKKIDAVIDELNKQNKIEKLAITQQERIDSLRVIFTEYQNKIYDLIKEKIQSRDRLVYACYYEAIFKNGGRQETITQLWLDLDKSESMLSDFKSELQPLKHKYLIADDLLSTLSPKNQVDNNLKLAEFSEKYQLHEAKLLEDDETMLGKKILKTISTVLFIDRFGALFGWQPKDAKLAGVTGLFAPPAKSPTPIVTSQAPSLQ